MVAFRNFVNSPKNPNISLATFKIFCSETLEDDQFLIETRGA